jgi:aryl-alcohol dehydrogenase-like predicted oxidoreductase
VSPRFQGAHREHNEALVARLRDLARDKGASVAQVAIGWAAARGEDVVPIVGARRTDQVGTLVDGVTLDRDDLARIDALIPRGSVSGDRYPAAQMAHLDSERSSS